MSHPYHSDLPPSADFFESREAITTFLFLADPPEPVDIAVVLGSPTISSLYPALDLYHRGFTRKILITGRGPENLPRPEWELYRHHALAQGVPPEAILVEPNARNTLENFTLSAALIEREIGWSNLRKISISAKPFHMRRALMTARKNWPAHISYVMRPSNAPDDPPADRWWRSEHGRRFVLAELSAIGRYALEDHIGGF